MRALRYALAFLLVALLALCASPLPAQTLPPIPRAIVSQLGPVPVVVVPDLKCDGVAVFGCFAGVARTIYVRDSMPVAVQWQVLFHEQFHIMLFDAGLSLRLPDGSRDPMEDRLADAIATARVNELLTLIQVTEAATAAANRAAVEQAGHARPGAVPAPHAPSPPR